MNFNKTFFLSIIGCILCYYQTHAQAKNEIGIINDNDLYVSIYLDEFYTNGLELFYKKVADTRYAIFNKRIKHIALGQNIYNPQESNVPYVYVQERPYAGYLYLNYSEHLINNKNILSLGATVGVTHDKSGAESAQNFIHQFYKLEPSEGWEKQIKEKYAVGLMAHYTRNILCEKYFSASWVNKTTLNTVFANVTSGLAFRVIFLKTVLNPIDNTTFFGTALQNNTEQWIKEIYFGVKSYATYQIQDYTITGELENNPSQKEFNLEPWTWLNDLGFYWNLKHTNLSYHIIYKTRETNQMNTKITRYGSLQFSYKF